MIILAGILMFLFSMGFGINFWGILNLLSSGKEDREEAKRCVLIGTGMIAMGAALYCMLNMPNLL